MKKFRTVKCGTHFYMDYDQTIEIIKQRKPQLLEGSENLPEHMVDALCCGYLDGLDNYDIWDYFESAVMYTHCDWGHTEVIEED